MEKLKYAIHFCKSIDTDEYARVAADPTEATGSEDNSDFESVSHLLSISFTKCSNKTISFQIA